MIRRPPRSTLFPCRPPFRSWSADGQPYGRSLSPPTRPLRDAVRRGGPGRGDGGQAAAAAPAACQRKGSPVPHISCRDRQSTRLELQSRQYLVCRLLLEKQIV